MRFFRFNALKGQLSALILAGLLAVLVANSAYASDGGLGKGGGQTPPKYAVRASVSCSGTGCNGLNPSSTGCSSGAYTATSKWVNPVVGSGKNDLLETRWSPTCQTNWARITFNYTGDIPMGSSIELVNSSGVVLENDTLDYSNTVQYGMMYYAPNTLVKACLYAPAIGFLDCTGLA